MTVDTPTHVVSTPGRVLLAQNAIGLDLTVALSGTPGPRSRAACAGSARGPKSCRCDSTGSARCDPRTLGSWRSRLLLGRRTLHHLVATHAHRDWGNSRIYRTLCRKVAELAIHSVLSGLAPRVLIVRERDRLTRRGSGVLTLGTTTLNERNARQHEDTGESADQPVLFHVGSTAPGCSKTPGTTRAQGRVSRGHTRLVKNGTYPRKRL